MKTILAIDQGTTGTTAALIRTDNFEFIGKVGREHPQIYPRPGLVEHDLNDIWSSVGHTVQSVLQKYQVDPSDLQAIGLTNQRETTCAFHRDGTPLHNAIVWQDRRTTEHCKALKAREEFVREKTGLPLDPYFSATKMAWLLKHSPSVQEALSNQNLLLGTIDAFLLYKLSKGQTWATEPSNASRTLLMNLKNGEWDDELLSTFEIPRSTLPPIRDSWGEFGTTQGLDFLPDGIPITGILGDQQAALFGQGGTHRGAMKCTYGTGAFMLLNTGKQLERSPHGLLTTIAFRGNNETYYALEGASYIAGAAVQWLRDNLQIISSAPESEALAKQVSNLQEMEHLLFMPFFTGLGSPYWVSGAKAAIVGITRDTGRSHLARACLEGICLSINDLIESMRRDTKLTIKNLKVDGGAVANNFLCQTQANFSDLEIIRPQVIETTAYGAALAAAVGSNLISVEEIQSLWKSERSFYPESSNQDYCQKKLQQWKTSIKQLFLATT